MAKYFKFFGIIGLVVFLSFGTVAQIAFASAFTDCIASGKSATECSSLEGAEQPVLEPVTGGLVPCGPVSLGFSHACTVCDFFVLIDKIIDFISVDIVPPLALLLIIIGGVMMIISGGSETQYKKGKTIITSAIVGLLIIWGSWIIIDTIMSGLTSLGSQGTAPNFTPWNTIQCQ